MQELVVGEGDTILCGETVLVWEDMEVFVATVIFNLWNTFLAMEGVYRTKFITSPEYDSIGNVLHLFEYKDHDIFNTAKFAWILEMARHRRVTD